MHRHAGGADGLRVLQSPGRHSGPPGRSAFLVTARTDPRIRAAIAGISDDAWTPIRYPRAIWDDQLGRRVSDAQVAEVEYMAFTSRKGQAVAARTDGPLAHLPYEGLPAPGVLHVLGTIWARAGCP
jgi:hypothetical protein